MLVEGFELNVSNAARHSKVPVHTTIMHPACPRKKILTYINCMYSAPKENTSYSDYKYKIQYLRTIG